MTTTSKPTSAAADATTPTVKADNTIKKSVDELLAALNPKSSPVNLSTAEKERLRLISEAEGYFVNVGTTVVGVAGRTSDEQALKKALAALKTVKDSTVKAIKGISDDALTGDAPAEYYEGEGEGDEVPETVLAEPGEYPNFSA